MYQVKLTQFEGPLDLLLHLIGNAKISIEEIFVSDITEQYLEYMQQLDELDMDLSSEFITMAANLIYIKSRSLLPRVEPELEEEEENPEQALIERLREYSIVKKVGERLQALEQQGIKSFYRLPEDFSKDKHEQVTLDGITLEKLYIAFLNLLERIDREENTPSLSYKHDTYSVRDKMAHIISAVLEQGKIKFCDLFFKKTNSLEIAVTFLALLELIAEGQITISQENQFADIIIS